MPPSPAPPLRPSLFARLSVNHTKKTCCISLLIPILALLIAVFSRQFSLNDPTSDDYLVRHDIRTRLDDARAAAKRDFPFQETPQEDVERSVLDDDYNIAILLRGKVDGNTPIFNITSDRAPNVFTIQGLQLLKQGEDLIYLDEQYTRFCWHDQSALDCNGNVPVCALPYSILNHPLLYGIQKNATLCGREPGSHPISQQDFDAFLASLWKQNPNAPPSIDPTYSIFFVREFSQEEQQSWVIRSQLDIGFPFKGFPSASEDGKEQEVEYQDWTDSLRDRFDSLSNDQQTIFIIGVVLANSVFGEIALRDLSFSIAAIVLVFIVIWFHTTSAWLASISMLQIFLSFPLAYFFYRFIFQQLYFAALQILAIFLILGIGADDVFVFTDAWKQAPVVLGKTDLVTRMTWTYRRAVKTMTVTSVTTAAAFFVTATSPIMPISTLGVWAGLLILLQFALVITVYPCAVIIWERFWRQRLFVRFFRKPREEEAEYQLNLPFYQRFLPKKWRNQPDEKLKPAEYRALERFFRGPWHSVICKARFFIFSLAISLVAVSIWLATRLGPPTTEENFLPSDHPFSTAFDTIRQAFPVSEASSQLNVRITWGIKDVDRKGTSKFDVSKLGTIIFDDEFDFRSAEVQQQVLDSCKFFGEQKQLIFQGETITPVICWIEQYLTWRKQALGEDGFKTFEKHQEQVDELLRFAKSGTGDRKPNRPIFSNQLIAFDIERTRVIFTETRFVSSADRVSPYAIMWPIYNEWQDLLREFNARAPVGGNNAIATGGFSWKWQITQRTLVRSMFSGIAIMLAVASVALTFSTLNVPVSILATLSIAGIVAMLLGIVSLLGWDLGVTETVGVVISVGYSFDGVAHIATAYVESKSETRLNRVRDALTDLGISILFGAISTLLAGFMLFPAIITFFVKFAGLLIITIALNLLWSLLFFPATLMILGPTGTFGSLRPIFRSLTACLPFWKLLPEPEPIISDEESGKNEKNETTETDSL